MSEWKEYKLGEIITLNYGKALKSENRIYGEIPVYSSAGITGFHNQYLINSKSLIVGRKGTIGKVYKCDTPFWCIDTAYYILPDDTKYNFDFLFYLIKTIGLEELNEDSAVPGLNKETAYSQVISLPPRPEQTAIASVLSSLDNKIDLLHRQNATLEKMAETLFRQWFVEEAKEEWEVMKLDTLGEIICGKTPSKKILDYFINGTIPFIKIPDMHGKTFVLDSEDKLTEKGLKSQQNKTIPPKSICVSCIATVGLVVMNAEKSQTNQQINTIIPIKEIYRYFLYLKMQTMKDDLLAMASGGTATDNLNTGNFSKIQIQLPNEKKLIEFHGTVNPIFNKIYTNQTQIRTLMQLRDTLLPKLMSGEVRVEKKSN
jgi:type I restriction enzyme S subunit